MQRRAEVPGVDVAGEATLHRCAETERADRGLGVGDATEQADTADLRTGDGATLERNAGHSSSFPVRSTCLRILPTEVRGSSSTNSMKLGTLNRTIRSAQKPMISSSVTPASG